MMFKKGNTIRNTGRTRFKKGHIPWNKGLTMSDPRVKRNIEKRNEIMLNRYGCLHIPLSPEKEKERIAKSRESTTTKKFRDKISHIVEASWQNPVVRARRTKGLRKVSQTEEYRKKIGRTSKKAWENNPQRRIEQSKRIKSMWQNLEFREREISKREKRWQDPTLRERQRKRMKRLAKIKEWLEKISKGVKEHYRNASLEAREKRLRSIFLASQKRPNKTEMKLMEILQEILPNEYRYVGDGSLILGWRCPDFMNKNGKKKLIELYGDYWHQGENPQERIKYFKEYGFDTLIIWEHELKNLEPLSEKIIEFNSLALGIYADHRGGES